MTGGSRGIGAAVARALGARGGRVVINYRESADAAEQIAAAGARRGRPGDHRAGRRDEPGRRAAGSPRRRSTSAAAVDILVNNATPSIDRKPFEELSWDEVDRYWNTYVRSVFELSQHVLPGMKERGFGRIIHILTTAMWGTPPAGTAGYVAAKSGLWGLAKSMAVELAPHGVTVNAVSPSAVMTDQWADASDSRRRALTMSRAGQAARQPRGGGRDRDVPGRQRGRLRDRHEPPRRRRGGHVGNGAADPAKCAKVRRSPPVVLAHGGGPMTTADDDLRPLDRLDAGVLLQAILRRWYVVLLCVLVTPTVAYLVADAKPDEYEVGRATAVPRAPDRRRCQRPDVARPGPPGGDEPRPRPAARARRPRSAGARRRPDPRRGRLDASRSRSPPRPTSSRSWPRARSPAAPRGWPTSTPRSSSATASGSGSSSTARPRRCSIAGSRTCRPCRRSSPRATRPTACASGWRR